MSHSWPKSYKTIPITLSRMTSMIGSHNPKEPDISTRKAIVSPLVNSVVDSEEIFTGIK